MQMLFILYTMYMIYQHALLTLTEICRACWFNWVWGSVGISFTFIYDNAWSAVIMIMQRAKIIFGSECFCTLEMCDLKKKNKNNLFVINEMSIC